MDGVVKMDQFNRLFLPSFLEFAVDAFILEIHPQVVYIVPAECMRTGPQAIHAHVGRVLTIKGRVIFSFYSFNFFSHHSSRHNAIITFNITKPYSK